MDLESSSLKHPVMEPGVPGGSTKPEFRKDPMPSLMTGVVGVLGVGIDNTFTEGKLGVWGWLGVTTSGGDDLPWGSVSWWSCCSTNRVQLCISFPMLVLCSSFSQLRRRPSADASRRVRKARRKLLAWQLRPSERSSILKRRPNSQAKQNSLAHRCFWMAQRRGSMKYSTWQRMVGNRIQATFP